MLEPEAGLIACNLGMCAAPARKRHKLYIHMSGVNGTCQAQQVCMQWCITMYSTQTSIEPMNLGGPPREYISETPVGAQNEWNALCALRHCRRR